MAIKKRASLYRGTPRNLARLAGLIARGEIVAVPTETVYGLAGDALNPAACRKIFFAKGRPTNDPLIVHIHSLNQLAQIAETSPEVRVLANAFWPGPLTLVLPKKPVVPAIVTAGLPSVAVRMPRHPVFRALLKLSGRPMAAPSANRFGYISPTTAQHVLAGLGEKISAILDGGAADIGLESTILDLRNPRHPTILRPGAISAQEIGRVLRRKVSGHRSLPPSSAATGAVAPGMLPRHYSPRTPISLHARLSISAANQTPLSAFLFLSKPEKAADHPNVRWLSLKPDLRLAARNLFAALRALDDGRWQQIFVQRAPGKSALALAINDRLRRAAAR